MGFKRSSCTFIIPASKLEQFMHLFMLVPGNILGKPGQSVETLPIFRHASEVRVDLMFNGGTDFALSHLVDARIPFFLCYDGCDGEYEAGWLCWASHMQAVLHFDGCMQPHVKQMPDCTFKITYQTLVKATLHNSELDIDIDNGCRKGTLMQQLNSLNSVLNTIEETK